LSWLIVPQALMLLLTLVTPLYALRYMSFVTPALALLMSFAIVAVTRMRHREWIALALMLALVGASLMTYLGQRQPFAKDNGTDFAQVAATIGEQANRGDAIIFDPTIRPSQRPRLSLRLYPEDFTLVTDVLLSRAYDTRSGLWDTQHSITDSASYFDGYERVWVVEARYSSTWALTELESQGFTVVQVIPENHCVIYELERL
jgi:mannosyltransferase